MTLLVALGLAHAVTPPDPAEAAPDDAAEVAPPGPLWAHVSLPASRLPPDTQAFLVDATKIVRNHSTSNTLAVRLPEGAPPDDLWLVAPGRVDRPVPATVIATADDDSLWGLFMLDRVDPPLTLYAGDDATVIWPTPLRVWTATPLEIPQIHRAARGLPLGELPPPEHARFTVPRPFHGRCTPRAELAQRVTLTAWVDGADAPAGTFDYVVRYTCPDATPPAEFRGSMPYLWHDLERPGDDPDVLAGCVARQVTSAHRKQELEHGVAWESREREAHPTGPARGSGWDADRHRGDCAPEALLALGLEGRHRVRLRWVAVDSAGDAVPERRVPRPDVAPLPLRRPEGLDVPRHVADAWMSYLDEPVSELQVRAHRESLGSSTWQQEWMLTQDAYAHFPESQVVCAAERDASPVEDAAHQAEMVFDADAACWAQSMPRHGDGVGWVLELGLEGTARLSLDGTWDLSEVRARHGRFQVTRFSSAGVGLVRREVIADHRPEGTGGAVCAAWPRVVEIPNATTRCADDLPRGTLLSAMVMPDGSVRGARIDAVGDEAPSDDVVTCLEEAAAAVTLPPTGCAAVPVFQLLQ